MSRNLNPTTQKHPDKSRATLPLDAYKYNQLPVYRVFLSRAVVFIYNFLMKRKEICYTSLFRLYKGNLLREINIENNNFLAMTEIKIKLLMKGVHFLEISANNNYRQYGQSKMKVLKNIIEHLKFMSKVAIGKIRV